MLNLDELNSLSSEEFVDVIGPVFEHSPWVAQKASTLRPFESRDDLHAALCQTVRDADAERRLALIRAHPDLAGRAVLTKASRGEQASADLDRLSEEEVERFDKYNRQ